jgi:hypothetical protein
VTKRKKPEAEKPPQTEEEIVSVKGFDLSWKCRDFQFALGQTYIHDGDVEACSAGFHAISGHPLEVFNYYEPATSACTPVWKA